MSGGVEGVFDLVADYKQNAHQDTAQASFALRKALRQHPCSLYKAAASMGRNEQDPSRIWLKTTGFRFDYRVDGNRLVEVDKMGDQGIFVRVDTFGEPR